MVTWWFGAAVAGIAGAPHCLGMCGALACAAGERPAHQLGYHLGRIGTYAALGALSGTIGQIVPGPPWVGTALAAVLLVGFAASLAGLLPEPRALPGLARLGAAFARRSDLGSRVALGVVNGLLPCGLVYATLSLAVAAADPVRGASVMVVFGACTVPALAVAAVGLRRAVLRSRAARRVLAAAVLIVGLATLGFRAGLFSDAPPGSVPPCHAAR